MPQSLQGKTILVVDDDPDIVTAIKTALSGSGAAIKTAADGNSAVAAVEREAPDLVILDIMLPQKSGFLVVEQLRRKTPRGQGPKIIMITGNQGQRHRDYARSLGIDDYIVKPFRMERLVEAAEKLLGS